MPATTFIPTADRREGGGRRRFHTISVAGLACSYEDGTWVLTRATSGGFDAKLPPWFSTTAHSADELPAGSCFTAALAQAQPIGCPAFHAFSQPADGVATAKLERFSRGIVLLAMWLA